MAAPKQLADQPAGTASAPRQQAPPADQSSWVPQWVRDLARGKETTGKEVGGAEKGVGAGVGGLRGLLAGKAATLILGKVGAFGHLIPSIPLIPYLAGGALTFKVFLQRATPPPWYGFPGGGRNAPLLITNPVFQAVGRFFVGPAALLITGISTILRKTVLKKTPNENLLYPFFFGITTVGTEEPLVPEWFRGLPGIPDEIASPPGGLWGLLIPALVGGLGEDGAVPLIPVGSADP